MLFGTIKNYDETKGLGSIRPENGHADLPFDRSAVSWGNEPTSRTDRRMSYKIGRNKDGVECAVNVQPV